MAVTEQIPTDIPDLVIAQETTLMPIDRRVFNESLDKEHALGARAVHANEMVGVYEEEEFHAAKELDKHQTAPPGINRSEEATTAATPAERAELKFLLASQKARNSRRLHNESLSESRQSLIKRSKDHSIVFNRIGVKDLPPYLFAQYGQYKGDDGGELPADFFDNLHDWMLEDSEQGSQRLLHFLQYRVATQEKNQDSPLLREKLVEEQTEWIEAVEKGSAQKWLHPDSVRRARERMPHLTVVYGDYFDLDAKRRSGYAVRGREYVVLGSTTADIESVAKHEFNHVLLGQLEGTWLDEAVTEHLAQVLGSKKEVSDVIPKGGGYVGPRTLLATIIAQSKGRISVSDFTFAYSTVNPTEKHKTIEALNKKIDSAFGTENFLSKVTQAVSERSEWNIKEGNISPNEALEIACTQVSFDLLNPTQVLGEGYDGSRQAIKAKEVKQLTLYQ